MLWSSGVDREVTRPSPSRQARCAPLGSDLMVTTTADHGRGSLRQALLDANAGPGPHTIRFDSVSGPFATPRTIALESELPELTGEMTIDGYIEGRLWEATGVTLTGGEARRVLSVAPGAKVTVASLTITEGRAAKGAGLVNRGQVVVKGVTFLGNLAESDGGGLANLGGTVSVINSTFVDNRAGHAGGGLANVGGTLTVTNCTFSGNAASRGGGLFSDGTLLLRNTILANSVGQDCVSAGTLDPAGTHNLIEANVGCGEPVTSDDPRLEPLGLYNGPTPTLPLGGGSPAINLGDNASAVDELGERLVWDQRGNGDPRFVAGITDIGAFEVQAFPSLVVNTVEDVDRRACGGPGRSDCSLRGAIALANAAGKASVITFDPRLFATPQTIVCTRPLPEITGDVTIDGRPTGGVTLRAGDLRPAPSGRLTIREVSLH
jgi:CSLREA domain-containing protein